MYEVLISLVSAVIAAAATLIAVLFTQRQAKRLANFQAFFSKKLEAYSAFWAELYRYQQEGSPESRTRFNAALHTVFLFAPRKLYKYALDAATHLDERLCLSGDEIRDLVDLMRLDLDECQRMKPIDLKPIGKKITLEWKEDDKSEPSETRN